MARPKTLGELVRARRRELGYTLAELGARLDLANGNFVGMVERGERMPGNPLIDRLAEVLGVPARDLLALKLAADPRARVAELLAPAAATHPRLRSLLLGRCDTLDAVRPEFEASALGALERLAWHGVLHHVLVPGLESDEASPLALRDQLIYWRRRQARDPAAELHAWWFEREADLVVPYARAQLKGWGWDPGRLALTVEDAESQVTLLSAVPRP